MAKQINQGRYTANISRNSGGFLVIVTRDGDCLPGIPSRSYVSAKTAETVARKLLQKAAA